MTCKKLLYYLTAPIIFGVFSLILGQDRSYDLAGYHYYNAFAFLNNKTSIDFSVAGAQGFLNPILDIPYYYLNQITHPAFVGFIFGFLNGFLILLLYKIIEIVISHNKKHYHKNLILFLSVVGCLTPNFLSSLGNSLGDNITSLFILFSLYLLILNFKLYENKKIEFKNLFILLIIGFFVGFPVGLKLTNAPFSLAFLIAFFLAINNSKKNKLFLLFSLGISSFVGFLSSGGFWFLHLWNEFSNPFFPLLSNIFPNKISSLITLSSELTPKNISQAIFYPFLRLFGFKQNLDSLGRQILWPTLYLLIFLFLFVRLELHKVFSRKSNLSFKSFFSVEKFLIFYVFFGYILWMAVFGIQRYLVSIELFAPLAIYVLIKNFNYNEYKRNVFFLFLCLFSVAYTLLGGFGTWGHTRWVKPAIFVAKPAIENPSTATVLMTDMSPIAWMLTEFPSDLAFLRLYAFENIDPFLNDFIHKRDGKFYVIFSGHYNWRNDNVKKWDNFLSVINVKKTKQSCENLDSFITFVKFRGKVKYNPLNSNESCFLDIADKDRTNQADENNKLIEFNNQKLEKFNFTLNKSSCKAFPARLGKQNWSYVWCEVN
jgi:hypothetical protein